METLVGRLGHLGFISSNTWEISCQSNWKPLPEKRGYDNESQRGRAGGERGQHKVGAHPFLDPPSFVHHCMMANRSFRANDCCLHRFSAKMLVSEKVDHVKGRTRVESWLRNVGRVSGVSTEQVRSPHLSLRSPTAISHRQTKRRMALLAPYERCLKGNGARAATLR